MRQARQGTPVAPSGPAAASGIRRIVRRAAPVELAGAGSTQLEGIPMLPDPLHPAVVHFPIVLASLLPLVALLGFLAVGRGAAPRRAWGYVTLAAFLLFAAAFTAVRTGGQEEETVEEVVDHDIIHDHEEAGERLQLLAGIGFLVIAAGLSGGGLGRIARPIGLLASLALAGQAYLVGRSGGELVYQHGAASAYVETPAVPAPSPMPPGQPGDDD